MVNLHKSKTMFLWKCKFLRYFREYLIFLKDKLMSQMQGEIIFGVLSTISYSVITDMIEKAKPENIDIS